MTKETLRTWLGEAKPKDEFMLVVCDRFDYSDYPVYCSAKECLDKIKNPGEMQKVMEVFDLSNDLEKQICSRQAWNPPNRFQSEALRVYDDWHDCPCMGSAVHTGLTRDRQPLLYKLVDGNIELPGTPLPADCPSCGRRWSNSITCKTVDEKEK